MVVLKFSIPVLLLDELLKFIARKFIDGNKNPWEIVYLTAAWAAFFALIYHV
jgi:Ca2+ transporting ATPase